MGQRLIISEEERKEILIKYLTEKIINEQKKSMTGRIYGLIKNLPLVRKIEKSYDPDLKKHIVNLIKLVPKLKNKEQELLNNIPDEKMSSEDLAKKISSQVTNISNSKLNEQVSPGAATPTGWIIALPALIFTILFIRRIIYDRNNPKPIPSGNTPTIKTPQSTPKPPVPPKSEVDKKLEILNGKTVNLYNDPEEQILFGTETVNDFRFFDNSTKGGRSGVKFGLGLRALDIDPNSQLVQKFAKIYGIYEIICLSNPVRLANFIVKEGEYSKDYKYNRKFTDVVGQIAGEYCKAPSADFSVVGKPTSQDIA